MEKQKKEKMPKKNQKSTKLRDAAQRTAVLTSTANRAKRHGRASQHGPTMLPRYGRAAARVCLRAL